MKLAQTDFHVVSFVFSWISGLCHFKLRASYEVVRLIIVEL
jgi:hypothetical protein